MEKSEHIDLFKSGELDFAIIKSEDNQQNCLEYQNSLESNNMLDFHFLDSNEIEDKTVLQNVEVDSYKKLQTNINKPNNLISFDVIQMIQRQKGISDLTLQKITTSLMLSQMPKMS